MGQKRIVKREINLQVGGCCLPPYFTKKCISILTALCHATDSQRISILKSSDHNIIRCICECTLNILRGTIPLENRQISKLKKYKNIIRNLVTEKNNEDIDKNKKKKKKINWFKKKKTIVQHGSGAFLPLILTPFIEILLTQLLKK